MIDVVWQGGMAFDASVPSGHAVRIDASIDSGGQNSGPSPIELVVASIAACSAMDVISILHKQRQEVVSYHIEVEWSRTEPDVYPRPLEHVRVTHVVRGPNVRPEAVQRAVKLSDEKYCGVIASFRTPPKIVSDFRVES